MKIERPKKLSVKLSEEELERWHRAADGEPLAVFVRLLVNEQVRVRLRSFGEGDGEAAIAAPAALAPSPEEPDPFSDVPFEDEVNPEIEEPSGEEHDPASSNALLDPNCRVAGLHWRIPRGEYCHACLGRAT